jgi:4-hydroxybenzoyl-CoA reductase subunit beta
VLRLPSFAYQPAATIEEAVDLLDRNGADALPVSGGTDLYPNMKQRLFTPKVLVGLRSIAELRGITYDEIDGLQIGALTTLRTLAANDIVNARYRALATASGLISTPQLRSMGTIGGNVCLDTRCTYYNQTADWREALGYCLKKDGDICRVAPGSSRCLAVNSSDLAPVLQAFDATIHLAGPGGRRAVKIARFFGDDGRHALALEPNEIVTRVSVPPVNANTRSAYRKLRLRDSFDFPLVGVAAVVRLDDDGVCADARLVLGAVAARPLEVVDGQRALIGTRLEADALAQAADRAFALGKPMENASTSPIYRKRMLRVFAYRTLEDVAIQFG